MMEQQGLAQMGQAQGLAGIDPQMIEQVVQALMSGASPEELIDQGVPAEVVEAAMQQLQSQVQQTQPPVQEPGGGLARMG